MSTPRVRNPRRIGTWGHFGVILGSLWGHFGVTLGPLWSHFGNILGQVFAKRSTIAFFYRGTIKKIIIGPEFTNCPESPVLPIRNWGGVANHTRRGTWHVYTCQRAVPGTCHAADAGTWHALRHACKSCQARVTPQGVR